MAIGHRPIRQPPGIRKLKTKNCYSLQLINLTQLSTRQIENMEARKRSNVKILSLEAPMILSTLNRLAHFSSVIELLDWC